MKEVSGMPPNLPEAVGAAAVFGILDERLGQLFVLIAFRGIPPDRSGASKGKRPG
jgi:hypothetical protein